ncbi:hypothetical protein [uncultured Aquitalea sp.]|nr:hypothetical protein [uncultured Aquitalea sp.]
MNPLIDSVENSSQDLHHPANAQRVDASMGKLAQKAPSSLQQA